MPQDALKRPAPAFCELKSRSIDDMATRIFNLAQVTGPSVLNPAYGVPIGFPQQELEAEREEYEDDDSEADDMAM